jgi:hypothetical protein
VAAAQVLLAMVFLAIIGGSGGYLAAHRQKQHHLAVAQSSSPPSAAPATATPAPSDQPVSALSSPSKSISPTSSGQECPAPAEKLAGNIRLYELLYLLTARSEVWICKDAGGKLYYQGHSLTLGRDLIEGKTALFLKEVTTDPDVPGGFVATNVDNHGTTRYHVSPQQLVTEINGKANQPEPAVSSRPS